MAARHAALFIAFFTGACSGAGNQDLFEGSSAAQTDVEGTLPTPTPSATSTPTSGPTDTPPPASPPSTPTPEPETCVAEKENNNNAANANEFKTCFKGQLSNNNDVDWGSFVVPEGTKSTSWTHKENGGKVTYRFQLEGIPVDVGPSADGDLRLMAGSKYVVRVGTQTGSGGGTKTWELNLSFK